jgi:hypothetical protein
MAILSITQVQCLEETNEVGSDSIYFVILIGKTRYPFTNTVKSISWFWEDIDKGETVSIPFAVDSQVDADSLILVTMMEKDDGTDIVGKQLTKVRNWMSTMFDLWVGKVMGMSKQEQAERLIPEMKEAIDNYRTNDDIVNTHFLDFADGSTDKILIFVGDGGKYKVSFKLS